MRQRRSSSGRHAFGKGANIARETMRSQSHALDWGAVLAQAAIYARTGWLHPDRALRILAQVVAGSCVFVNALRVSFGK